MSIGRSTPAEQGIDPAGIAAFIDALERHPAIEPHGLVIQRNGVRVTDGCWRPHALHRARLLYSLSKTFTGTALALQLGEGRLRLDDLVSDYLPHAFEGAHPDFRALRIRHIASMATGHDHETIGEAAALDPEGDVLRGFLRIPPAGPPGTVFAYNQPPVLALATVLQQLAGERLVDYLRPRLFEPLGMGDVRSTQRAPGMDPGYTGVYASLDAVARLGQLYLDDGVWEGRRILPEGWVAQASAMQVSNAANSDPDWRTGYGFQLWRSRHGYRGDGASGQYMVVLPEQRMVVALLSCTEGMQRVLDLMWEHLLPALGVPRAAGPGDAALADRLASLSLPTAQERHGGQAVAALEGRFVPAADAQVSHRTITALDAHERVLTLHEGEQTLRLALTAEWTEDASGLMATSAAQLADGSIAVDVVVLATPHRLELRLDTRARTFTARWPVRPLFGAGIGRQLTAMRVPQLTA